MNVTVTVRSIISAEEREVERRKDRSGEGKRERGIGGLVVVVEEVVRAEVGDRIGTAIRNEGVDGDALVLYLALA